MKRLRCISVRDGSAVFLAVIPGVFVLIGLSASGALAQGYSAPPAASANSGDDAKASTEAGKPGDKKEKSANDQKPAPVTPGEVLSFRQSKVAAEMTELEERMYRLSEALKALEPENSSRLMLGLKFAREELILHQMKETQKLLDRLTLAEAA
ncbi:MAG: hypothetical protein ACREJM_07720, partial [Candidatus Saccharimonadales bacterium]